MDDSSYATNDGDDCLLPQRRNRRMKPNRIAIGALVLPLAMCLVGAIPAAAQNDSGNARLQEILSKRVNLNLENADIKYALKLLFNSAGANFTLDPFVQGTVTVSLSDVLFKTALESILRSTNSTN